MSTPEGPAHPEDMTTSTATREPLLTRPFVLLAVADLCYFTAVGVSIYALPLYATGPLGSGEAGAGLAFGAFAVTAMLLRPWAGRLADRRGRMPLLLAGALICAVTMVGTAHADQLATVVALRLLLGAAEAAFFVASFAALADLAPPSRMGEALSYNSLGLYLGLALGPPLGELLVTRLDFTAAWYGAGLLALVGALVVPLIGETRTGPVSDGRQPLLHRRSIPVALAFVTSIVAMAGFLAFSALYAGEVGLARTSAPLFLYGLVVVTCRIAFARVVDRFPPLALGAAALATMATGLLVAAAFPTPAGLLTGTVVLAVGITFSTPAFFAAIFARATPSERGAAAGTASLAMDVGLGAGPIVLGLVAESAGIPWAFAVGAATSVVGSLWALQQRRWERGPRRLPALRPAR